MKKLLLNAAFVLAELVLKGLVLAVLAIPVMIALVVAGLLSVLVQAMAFARRAGGACLGEMTPSHIWFTIGAEDPLYLRQCVLRMYWDGQSHPSVEAPVGDFFGVGHSKVASYSCAVMNMSANQGHPRFP